MRLEDLEEFGYNGYSNACGCAGADGVYSNAGGWDNMWSKYRKNQKIRQKQKSDKQTADVAQAQVNAKAIDAMQSQQGANDVATQNALKALDAPPVAGATKKGMSTGAKIGIGVGVVAVLVGGYFLMKHFKKKK